MTFGRRASLTLTATLAVIAASTAGVALAAGWPQDLRPVHPHDLQRRLPRGTAAVLHDRAPGPLAAVLPGSHCGTLKS